MFRLILAIAAFSIMLTSCGGTKPQTGQQTQSPSVTKDTVYSRISDTLKITDSVYIKEAISFRALQKTIDSLISARKTEDAIELLKIQVQSHNNLDQLGFRTLQLANLLYQTGHNAEAIAILESFAVYKPRIISWIDSADALHDKILALNKNKAPVEPPNKEVINSLTAQIRVLKSTKANPAAIIELADSLRSISPGDSVLAWLEKQVPSQYERADAFCEEQRKVATDKFAASRKRDKAKANALLTEAIEALDKCLAKTPSAGMKETVTKNREILVKELK